MKSGKYRCIETFSIQRRPAAIPAQDFRRCRSGSGHIDGRSRRESYRIAAVRIRDRAADTGTTDLERPRRWLHQARHTGCKSTFNKVVALADWQNVNPIANAMANSRLK